MSEDSVDELSGHLGGGLGVVIECGSDGKDGCAGVGCQLHVAKVDAVEWGFANTEEEGATLFEADVGSAVDEIVGEAVGDVCQSAHGAGKDDHGGGGVAAAGDVGPYVGFGVLMDFRRWGAEEFFGEVVAAAEVELFGEDAEGVFADD